MAGALTAEQLKERKALKELAIASQGNDVDGSNSDSDSQPSSDEGSVTASDAEGGSSSSKKLAFASLKQPNTSKKGHDLFTICKCHKPQASPLRGGSASVQCHSTSTKIDPARLGAPRCHPGLFA